MDKKNGETEGLGMGRHSKQSCGEGRVLEAEAEAVG